MADGDAAERAFALAARTQNESNRDAAIAAAKVAADQAIVDAKVIADGEMADEVQDRTDGDAAERAFALAARTANETARDAAIAAAKATSDAEIAAAKVVADGEMAQEQQDRSDGDTAERAFALAARTANETARDSSIAAAKQVADAEMAQVVSDLASYESSNDAAVQVERGRLDALLAGSDVDLDQLVELVAAYELADTDIITSITNETANRIAKDAEERAFALAARTADSAQRDQEIAAAKATSDAEIAAAKAVADQEMVDEVQARLDGDAAERAFALAARTANETARDAAIAAAKATSDAEIAAAKVVADGEMADEVQDRIDGDAAERAFALAARTLNESNRDSSIAAAKVLADQAIVDAKVIADGEMADEIQDRIDGDAAERAFALQARVDQLAAINGDVLVNDTFGKVEDAMDVDRAAAISYTNAETTRAQNAEGVLDAKVDTEIADRIQAVIDLHAIIDQDMLEEATARAAGDQINAASLLAEQQATSTDRAAIRSEFAAADAAQLSAIEGGVSAGYDTLKKIEDIVIANAATAASDNSSLEVQLKGDVATDYDTLGKLEDKIQEEAALARSEEGNLSTALSSEITRATGAEGVLDAKIDQTVVDLKGDVAAGYDTLGKLEDKIQEEATAARAAEGVLDAKIDSEVSTLKGGVSEAYDTMLKIENVIVANAAQAAADISAEASRATLAEQGLQTQINNVLSNVDPAALDSISELFTHFTDEDNDIDAALAALSASTTANLNALKAGSQSTIADLDAADAALSAAYQAADALQLSNLKGDVAGDYDTLGKLEDKIQAEASLARSEESRIEGLLGDEESRALAAEGLLGGRLDIVEGGVNQAGSVAKAEFDAKAYADAQIIAQEVLSAAARLAVQTDVNANEATMVSEFSAVRGELAQEVSDLLGGASASHNTMKKIEDLMIADAASASADIAAEASLARAEEAKLAADVLALHGRHDEYEQVMVSDFEADAFSLAAAAFSAPMSEIMSVHVNGFKLMGDEFTVSKVEGAMDSIVFHVPMYIGDAVSVSGMKKITLQS